MSIQCWRNSLATRFFTWDGTFQHSKSHTVGYSFSNNSFSLPAISHNLCTIAIVTAGMRPFQNQCSLGVFFLQVFPNCCGYLYVGFSQKNKDGWMRTPLALEETRILEWDLHCGWDWSNTFKQYLLLLTCNWQTLSHLLWECPLTTMKTFKNRFCSLAFEYILVRNPNVQPNVNRNFFMVPQVIKIVSQVLFDFQKS